MSGAFLRLTSADPLLQSCFLSVRNVSKFLSSLNVNKFLLNQKDEFLVSSPVFAHRFVRATRSKRAAHPPEMGCALSLPILP